MTAICMCFGTIEGAAMTYEQFKKDEMREAD